MRIGCIDIFEKKTLTVVGAGASSQAKLPTGSELKRKIAKLLDLKFPNGYRQNSGDILLVKY